MFLLSLSRKRPNEQERGGDREAFQKLFQKRL